MKIKYKDEYIHINMKGASLVARILNEDSIELEINDLNEEKINQFYEITKYNDLILIEDLKVDKDFRNKGLASKLMKALEKEAKEKDFKFLYLNACPILAEDGLNLEELESFYAKRGFKSFYNQKNNILMIRKLD